MTQYNTNSHPQSPINLSQQKEENNVLSITEKDSILRSLFLGKDCELDSSFLYKGKGAELYENISKDASYPYINIEINALNKLKNNSKIKNILKKTEYITDVGCGDGQKAFALLSKLFRRGTYILEDYSRRMIEFAEKFIKEHLPGLILGSSQKLNNGKHLSQQLSHNMYLFLGGTICNMSDNQIIDELKGMDNNGIFTGNRILLSYFTAPNSQEEIDNLIKIYNSHANKKFHENGMDMLGLSREDFEYDTVYEKDDPTQKNGPFPGKIKGIIRAKKDTSVILSNGEKIEIKQGQEFTLHYSRRFTQEGISKLFKESGCKTEFTISEKGDTIVLLKKAPKKSETFIKKYKTMLFTALIALGIGFGGGVMAEQYKKQQENQQKFQSNLELMLRGGKSIEQDHQKANELITALSLNKLDSKDKEIIISLFNLYIEEHGEGGKSNENLVIGFYKKYGWILINQFGLTHTPYDFFDIGTSSIFGSVSWLITNTLKFEADGKNEFSFTPDYTSDNKVHFKGLRGLDYGNFIVEEIIQSRGRFKSPAFEYNDGGKTYSILKVRFWEGDGKLNEIYVGTEKDKNITRFSRAKFTTDIINKEILNKEGLDPIIVSNTNKLGSFELVGNINVDGIEINLDPSTRAQNGKGLTLENTDKNMVIKHRGSLAINQVYVGGKLYYFVKVGNIGLASTSINGPFSTRKFNKMAKKFLKNASPYIGTYYHFNYTE